MVGVRLTGSNKKLMELASRMKRVSSTLHKKGLYTEMAGVMHRNSLKSFDKSVSPYGKKFAKLKYRKGKPLVKTGALRASIKPFADSKTFGVKTEKIYAATHNYGRPPIPQRQFIATNGVPSDVAAQLRKLITRRLKQAGLR